MYIIIYTGIYIIVFRENTEAVRIWRLSIHSYLKFLLQILGLIYRMSKHITSYFVYSSENILAVTQDASASSKSSDEQYRQNHRIIPHTKGA